jgi:hypothetical protein
VRVLVVDGANVVGSRPDGWWRDRAWAAQLLRDRLVRADLPADEVVLVLEGKARLGVGEGCVGVVRTVHARRSGDDTIVAEVTSYAAEGHDVVAVTADRALQERVRAAGGTLERPSWLLDRLG